MVLLEAAARHKASLLHALAMAEQEPAVEAGMKRPRDDEGEEAATAAAAEAARNGGDAVAEAAPAGAAAGTSQEEAALLGEKAWLTQQNVSLQQQLASLQQQHMQLSAAVAAMIPAMPAPAPAPVATARPQNPAWTEQVNAENGQTYYWNSTTNESTYTRPADYNPPAVDSP